MIFFLNNVFFFIKKKILYLRDKYFGFIKILDNLNFEIFHNKIIFYSIDGNYVSNKTFFKILNNLILGIKSKWKTCLEISGLGYKANIVENFIILNLGYSILNEIKIPEFIEVKLNKNQIILSSVYKDKLGLFVNKLINIKKYNPYKKKGIFSPKNVYLKKSNKKKQ